MEVLTLAYIGGFAVLILLNAFFVLAEFSIVKVRLTRPRDRLALAQDPLYLDYRTSVLEFLYQRQGRPAQGFAA